MKRARRLAKGRLRAGVSRWLTAALLAGLVLAMGAACVRRAAAQGLGRAGEALGLLTQSAGEQVWLNGLAFSVQARHSDSTLLATSQALESRCNHQATGAFGDPQSAVDRAWSGLFGAWSERRGGGVAVLCLAPGPSDGGLLDALDRFGQSGDLSELVSLELTWIHESRDGSRVVSVRPLGGLNLEEAFPAAGDAPGADLPGVARIEGGRRVVAAFAGGSGLWTYEHALSTEPGELRRAYAAALHAGGFEPAPEPARTLSASRFHGSDEAGLSAANPAAANGAALLWRNGSPVLLQVEALAGGGTTVTIAHGGFGAGSRAF